MDATLRELSINLVILGSLVKEVVPSSKKRDSEMHFSIIYYDSKGKFQKKEVGTVAAYKKGQDELKTLHQLEFKVGDLLDIYIKAN